jgi:hypothetical protein
VPAIAGSQLRDSKCESALGPGVSGLLLGQSRAFEVAAEYGCFPRGKPTFEPQYQLLSLLLQLQVG